MLVYVELKQVLPALIQKEIKNQLYAFILNLQHVFQWRKKKIF